MTLVAGAVPSTQIELRGRVADDDGFLLALYASTREDVLVFGWDDAVTRDFLVGQFRARERAYGEAYPQARSEIVMVAGSPSGRLLVDRRTDGICLVDVALLPERRGIGIGTRLIAQLLTEAQVGGVPMRLQVRTDNPARHLYERLGFVVAAREGEPASPEIYLAMEWRAG